MKKLSYYVVCAQMNTAIVLKIACILNFSDLCTAKYYQSMNTAMIISVCNQDHFAYVLFSIQQLYVIVISVEYKNIIQQQQNRKSIHFCFLYQNHKK